MDPTLKSLKKLQENASVSCFSQENINGLNEILDRYPLFTSLTHSTSPEFLFLILNTGLIQSKGNIKDRRIVTQEDKNVKSDVIYMQITPDFLILPKITDEKFDVYRDVVIELPIGLMEVRSDWTLLDYWMCGYKNDCFGDFCRLKNVDKILKEKHEFLVNEISNKTVVNIKENPYDIQSFIENELLFKQSIDLKRWPSYQDSNTSNPLQINLHFISKSEFDKFFSITKIIWDNWEIIESFEDQFRYSIQIQYIGYDSYITLSVDMIDEIRHQLRINHPMYIKFTTMIEEDTMYLKSSTSRVLTRLEVYTLIIVLIDYNVKKIITDYFNIETILKINNLEIELENLFS